MKDKVLIIEDSVTIRNVVKATLDEAGFDCDMSGGADEGFSKLFSAYETEQPFNVLILDWMLEGRSGAEIMQQLHDDERFDHLAIMIFTERPDSQAYRLASARPNNDILLKDEMQILPERLTKFLVTCRSESALIKHKHLQAECDDAGNNKKIKILLVDDSLTICAKYSALLEENGYEVFLAKNMQEGFDVATEKQPDLAVIDYMMPGGNGDELTRMLKSSSKTQDITVIIHSQRNDVLEVSLQAGAIDLIYKDDPVHVFLMRIESIEKVIASQRNAFQSRLLHRATDKIGIGVLIEQDNKQLPFNNMMSSFIKECGIEYFINRENNDDEFSVDSDANGHTRHFRQIPLTSETGDEIILTQDITVQVEQRRALEKSINEQKHKATHDPLTGLTNRRLLHELLEQTLAEHRRNNKQLAVLAIDLDRFKIINDTMGHDVGDELLVYVAKYMKQNRREYDIVSRVGGDEFIMVLVNIKPSIVHSICEDLIAGLSKPMQLSSHNVEIGASVGVAIFPDDGDNIKQLEKNADTSLYLAKQSGRGTYRFFDEKTNKQERRRQELMVQLKDALVKNEFSMMYQPRVDLKTNRIVGMESLMRWNNHKYGAVSPFEFIPLLENMDMISNITLAMMNNSLQALRKWLDINPDIVMSVNFSVKQLHIENMSGVILSMLKQYDIPPTAFELEITESLFLSERPQIMENLNALREMGCLISLDDFGTGYSSLSYLKRLPVDVLKIDREFIRDILEDENNKKLTEAIINIAKIYNLDVVAEGVETEEQRQLLEKLNCQFYQGYLKSKPETPENMQSMLFNESSTYPGLKCAQANTLSRP